MNHSGPETQALAAAGYLKPLKREDVTEMIVAAKIKKKLSWEQVAEKIGQSKEWTTTALLGQMRMTEAQAKAAGEIFGLPEDAVALLQVVPYKGGLPTAVPTDPLIYRLYEMVMIYGPTIKELIHEEFGDGIMSAIDFDMDLQRQADPKGDRVRLVLTGKYLAYKSF
jgi:cyanate lyase